MEIIFLAIGAASLKVLRDKVGIVSVSFFSTLYIYLSCLALIVVNSTKLNEKSISFSAIPLPNFDPVLTQTLTIYLLIILLLTANTIGLKKNSDNISIFLIKKLEKIKKNKNLKPIIYILIFITTSLNLIHLASIDTEVLLSNTFYLSIKNPELIGIDNSFMKIYHSLFRYTGILFICTFVIFLNRNNFFIWASSLVLFMYSFTFLAAGNSRWAALYIFILLLMSIMLRKRILALLSLPLLFLTLEKVLLGRSQYYHGLNHLFDYKSSSRNFDFFYTLKSMYINIFEGTFNLANTLLISPNHHITYKLLSFSPLFSALDGFNHIRESFEIRITPFVPMSAISESYSFGMLYFVIFLSFYLFSIRQIDKRIITSPNLFYIFLFFMFIYISFGMHTYSIRTFWKIIFFTPLMIYFYNRYTNEK